MNNEAFDQGWQELQSRLENLHIKYFGEDFHPVEFHLQDDEELVVEAVMD